MARDREVRIFTIAVGDPAAVGEEALDEDSLRKIAEVTGGAFYRASDRAALDDVCATLDELDTREHETQSHRPVRDLFHWPVGAAVLFALSGQLFMGTAWWLRTRRRGRA